jgi:hypothetical protein
MIDGQENEITTRQRVSLLNFCLLGERDFHMN